VNPTDDTEKGPTPVSALHPPTEADRAARQQLIAMRIARQVDLLGYLLVVVGVVGAFAAYGTLATGNSTNQAFAALVLPVGAGLVARGRLAANLTFLVCCAALAGIALLVYYGPQTGGFGFDGSLPVEERLLFGAVLAVVPIWGLRTLLRGVRIRLFDAKPLRMPGVRGEQQPDDANGRTPNRDDRP